MVDGLEGEELVSSYKLLHFGMVPFFAPTPSRGHVSGVTRKCDNDDGDSEK